MRVKAALLEKGTSISVDIDACENCFRDAAEAVGSIIRGSIIQNWTSGVLHAHDGSSRTTKCGRTTSNGGIRRNDLTYISILDVPADAL